MQEISEKFSAMHSELAEQAAVYIVEPAEGLHFPLSVSVPIGDEKEEN